MKVAPRHAMWRIKNCFVGYLLKLSSTHEEMLSIAALDSPHQDAKLGGIHSIRLHLTVGTCSPEENFR